MVVNDWQDPHIRHCALHLKNRSMLPKPMPSMILSLKKGSKVILASNSTNAQLVASEFGVKYFDAPVVDPFQYYEVVNDAEEPLIPDQKENLGCR